MIFALKITLFLLSGGILYAYLGERSKNLLILAGVVATIATAVTLFDIFYTSDVISFSENESEQKNQNVSKKENFENSDDSIESFDIGFKYEDGPLKLSDGKLLFISRIGSFTQPTSQIHIVNEAGQVVKDIPLGVRVSYFSWHSDVSGGFLVASCKDRISSECDMFVKKFDADGRLKWTTSYQDRNFRPSSIVSTKPGSYYVIGHQNQSGPTTSSSMLKLDSDGQLVFQRKLQIFDTTKISGSALIDGNIYVVGRANDSTFKRLKPHMPFVASLSLNGDLQWVKALTEFDGYYVNDIIQADKFSHADGGSWIALHLTTGLSGTSHGKHDVVYGVTSDGTELLSFQTNFERSRGLFDFESSGVGLFGHTKVSDGSRLDVLRVDGTQRYSYRPLRIDRASQISRYTSLGRNQVAAVRSQSHEDGPIEDHRTSYDLLIIDLN